MPHCSVAGWFCRCSPKCLLCSLRLDDYGAQLTHVHNALLKHPQCVLPAKSALFKSMQAMTKQALQHPDQHKCKSIAAQKLKISPPASMPWPLAASGHMHGGLPQAQLMKTQKWTEVPGTPEISAHQHAYQLMLGFEPVPTRRMARVHMLMPLSDMCRMLTWGRRGSDPPRQAHQSQCTPRHLHHHQGKCNCWHPWIGSDCFVQSVARVWYLCWAVQY